MKNFQNDIVDKDIKRIVNVCKQEMHDLIENHEEEFNIVPNSSF